MEAALRISPLLILTLVAIFARPVFADEVTYDHPDNTGAKIHGRIMEVDGRGTLIQENCDGEVRWIPWKATTYVKFGGGCRGDDPCGGFCGASPCQEGVDYHYFEVIFRNGDRAKGPRIAFEQEFVFVSDRHSGEWRKGMASEISSIDYTCE